MGPAITNRLIYIYNVCRNCIKWGRILKLWLDKKHNNYRLLFKLQTNQSCHFSSYLYGQKNQNHYQYSHAKGCIFYSYISHNTCIPTIMDLVILLSANRGSLNTDIFQRQYTDNLLHVLEIRCITWHVHSSPTWKNMVTVISGNRFLIHLVW